MDTPLITPPPQKSGRLWQWPRISWLTLMWPKTKWKRTHFACEPSGWLKQLICAEIFDEFAVENYNLFRTVPRQLTGSRCRKCCRKELLLLPAKKLNNRGKKVTQQMKQIHSNFGFKVVSKLQVSCFIWGFRIPFPDSGAWSFESRAGN